MAEEQSTLSKAMRVSEELNRFFKLSAETFLEHFGSAFMNVFMKQLYTDALKAVSEKSHQVQNISQDDIQNFIHTEVSVITQNLLEKKNLQEELNGKVYSNEHCERHFEEVDLTQDSNVPYMTENVDENVDDHEDMNYHTENDKDESATTRSSEEISVGIVDNMFTEETSERAALNFEDVVEVSSSEEQLQERLRLEALEYKNKSLYFEYLE